MKPTCECKSVFSLWNKGMRGVLCDAECLFFVCFCLLMDDLILFWNEIDHKSVLF